MKKMFLAVMSRRCSPRFQRQRRKWPTKPVKLIVPFAAGSTPDVTGRMLADYLQNKLGQTFIVENRPGASGNTGNGRGSRRRSRTVTPSA